MIVFWRLLLFNVISRIFAHRGTRKSLSAFHNVTSRLLNKFGTSRSILMRFISPVKTLAAMLAVTSLAVLPLMAQQTQQVKPGTDVTEAMGSKVEAMKPDCAPQTMSGNKQTEHPPTQAMDQKVPPMHQGDCPADDAVTGTKHPPK
jgi:hypothetical protein